MLSEKEYFAGVEKWRNYLLFTIKKMIHDHQESEDILQITIIKGWRHLDKFDGRHELITWLMKIALNTCIDYTRMTRGHQQAQTTSADEVNEEGETIITNYRDDALTAEEKLFRKELADELRIKINWLPQLIRDTLELKCKGYKLREIADILKVPLGTIKSAQFRGVRLLREMKWNSYGVVPERVERSSSDS